MSRLCRAALKLSFLSSAAVLLLLAVVVRLAALHPFTAGVNPLFHLGSGLPLGPATEAEIQELLPDLSGKTVLITGANAGLGLASAESLARSGANVLLACRSESKCQAAADRVRRVAAPSGGAEVYNLDTSDLASVRACALAIRHRHQHLDVVMLNAGVARLGQSFALANDTGAEMTLTANHLGHFLLVDLLDATLGQGSRVVVLTSNTHMLAPRNGLPLTKQEAADERIYHPEAWRPTFAALLPEGWEGNALGERVMAAISWLYFELWAVASGEDVYSGNTAYTISKFANMIYAQELAARLEPRGVLVQAVHPGAVKTNMMDLLLLDNWYAIDWIKSLESVLLHRTIGMWYKPLAGAYTQVYAAAMPGAAQLPPGSYLVPPGRVGIKDPRLDDMEMQRKFWALSEELTASFRDSTSSKAELAELERLQASSACTRGGRPKSDVM